METIKIYGVSDCPACLVAQAHAMEAYPKYEYIFVNMDFATAFRNNIKKKFDHQTYPIVTIQDENEEVLIGSSENLKTFLSK
tara:strand:+ start:45 stop:290 length:246 start_codon:yes stop_codon:yes gene_type:complete